MSVRMRHTRGHTRNRRSHHALDGLRVFTDENGTLRLPHRIDEKTGMYRGKHIFSPKAVRIKASKVKGPDTEPVAPHIHDHAAEHANAQVKGAKGILGKFGIGGRPQARSGFGGGA